MGSDKNDTQRAIIDIIEDLKAWVSDLADPRVKAIVITKLEEAELWASKLVKHE